MMNKNCEGDGVRLFIIVVPSMIYTMYRYKLESTGSMR